ncbi:MAG: endo-1,4-beta-xylanase, partial [Planctomycetota bacterium]|nr:endo-1,4-beta-xylanase [Planctomycetota bacterium]
MRIVDILRRSLSDASEPPTHRGSRPSVVQLWLCAAALTLLQLALAGTAPVVGNQTLQLAFVLHHADPSRFAADPAIAETVASYPSWCYRLLALVVTESNWPWVYAILHAFCAWILFGSLLAAARAWWGRLLPGIIASLILVAGHQRGLAGADGYVAGFTHTWLAMAVSPWILIAVWQGRWLLGGVLIGVLFDIHALICAYTTVFALAGFAAHHQRGDLKRGLACTAVASIVALPSLVILLRGMTAVDDTWFALMRLRSAHHSFPASLWQSGDNAIPRFASLLAITGAALPLLPRRERRRAIAIGLTFTALLAIGLLATGSASVIKAQLWRASGTLLPLLALVLGRAVQRGLRSDCRSHGILIAVATGALALPISTALLAPIALLTALSALLHGLLKPAGAAALGLLVAVPVAAAILIDVPFFGGFQPWTIAAPLLALFSLLLLALAIWARSGALRLSVTAAATLLIASQTLGPPPPNTDSWTAIQHATRAATAADAVILTPLHRSGFRIGSGRSVVCEWRDGTQLYFSPRFATTWWNRVSAVQADIHQEGGRLLDPGLPYELLNDEQLVALCAQVGASHLILPTRRSTALQEVASNADWRLCVPELPPPPPIPDAVLDEQRWQANRRFLKEVVGPNIIANRTSPLSVSIRDEHNQVPRELRYELELESHAFGFGSGLSLFVRPSQRPDKRYHPPVIGDTERETFLALFNYSIIPYSAKWMYLEPSPGMRWYEDLDAYVAWGEQNQIPLEYHFLTGYMPAWLKDQSNAKKQIALDRHADAIIERYGSRIAAWQVVNEKHLLKQSVPLFSKLRERCPEAKLGISDCARFFSDKNTDEQRDRDLLRGLSEIRWLREQGVKIDYYAIHAHRPFGLWADYQQAYRVLDALAAEGLRLHITEFGIHEHHEITGDLRAGTWNAQLQAQYYAEMFSLLYSHPAVDVVNLWGIGADTWMGGAGLLDTTGHRKPAFDALHHLIKDEWRTRASGPLPLSGQISIPNAHHGRYRLT